jgi:sulfite exporter TauE/SafE
LGGIVTFTHTISVIVVGLFALVASRFILPTALAPTLEIIAGLLVLGLGVRLIWQRWAAFRANRKHGHTHPHSHALPEKVKMSDLWAMGISGGLVPCPEALGILLIAIGLNRAGLGLSLIVAFSLGIALVLIVIGLLLVRSRGLLDKLGRRGGKIQKWLPLVSAAIVTLLGVGIAAKGLLSYPQQLQGLVTSIVLVLSLLILAMTFVLARRKAPQIVAVPAKKPISSAPMSSAPMVYQADGQVAWDEMWTDFCDLALAGGPPHRGTLLEPVAVEEVGANPANYERVLDELERGLKLITNLPIVRDAAPGWIGLVCPNEEMAAWLMRAIIVENVIVRREGALLFLPAGPNFRLEKEIKNVITVVAKTHHYWTEHNAEAAEMSLK